jgi:hypothetical protein
VALAIRVEDGEADGVWRTPDALSEALGERRSGGDAVSAMDAENKAVRVEVPANLEAVAGAAVADPPASFCGVRVPCALSKPLKVSSAVAVGKGELDEAPLCVPGALGCALADGAAVRVAPWGVEVLQALALPERELDGEPVGEPKTSECVGDDEPLLEGAPRVADGASGVALGETLPQPEKEAAELPVREDAGDALALPLRVPLPLELGEAEVVTLFSKVRSGVPLCAPLGEPVPLPLCGVVTVGVALNGALGEEHAVALLEPLSVEKSVLVSCGEPLPISVRLVAADLEGGAVSLLAELQEIECVAPLDSVGRNPVNVDERVPPPKGAVPLYDAVTHPQCDAVPLEHAESDAVLGRDAVGAPPVPEGVARRLKVPLSLKGGVALAEAHEDCDWRPALAVGAGAEGVPEREPPAAENEGRGDPLPLAQRLPLTEPLAVPLREGGIDKTGDTLPLGRAVSGGVPLAVPHSVAGGEKVAPADALRAADPDPAALAKGAPLEDAEAVPSADVVAVADGAPLPDTLCDAVGDGEALPEPPPAGVEVGVALLPPAAAAGDPEGVAVPAALADAVPAYSDGDAGGERLNPPRMLPEALSVAVPPALPEGGALEAV